MLKRNNSTLEIEKQIVIDNTGSYDYLNSITVDSFEKELKMGMIFLFISEIVSVPIVLFSQKY
ncbi:hypothetical protein [Bacillus sp. TH23]|uniref:hypothetical protein n=1 Tax=Bacillus sp. TH23 TaxID=2796389 RepID=UPI001F5BFD09|nr:hypothetical protein [Bacillus sp. TH23]